MKVRLKGYAEQTMVDDALKKYLNEVNIKSLQLEKTPILEALGRILAEDVKAELDVPHFNRSAVDGYAVKSEDTFGASAINPIIIDVLGVAEMGRVPNINVRKLQAVRISTGAPLPQGVDSVVMLEYTEKISEEKIALYRPGTPGRNVSKRGEDIKKGQKVLRKGTFLQPLDIGILAAIGVVDINIVRKPKVAILSTGNELIEPGKKISIGRIVDTNRLSISAAVKNAGGEPLDLGIAKDKMEKIRSKISKGLVLADLVLVSGGTSVGERDFVPEVVNSLGKPGIIIHGISMRPGKPTALAAVHGKPIILLPGYPVAAMMAFNTFVDPIIARMLGTSFGRIHRQVILARMMRRIPSSPGIRDFARVVVKKTDMGYIADPIRTKGAGIISSIVKANGLVVIPEEREGVEEGDEVEVTLLRPLEK